MTEAQKAGPGFTHLLRDRTGIGAAPARREGAESRNLCDGGRGERQTPGLHAMCWAARLLADPAIAGQPRKRRLTATSATAYDAGGVEGQAAEGDPCATRLRLEGHVSFTD
jgi:hypothetical protein